MPSHRHPPGPATLSVTLLPPRSCFGALAEACPEHVQADCGMMDLLTFQGKHPDGRDVSTIYFASGGFGALAGYDGPATTPGPSNMAVVPTELWETLTGTTIEHKRLLPDTGGAGEARGGVGQEVVIRNDTGAPLTVFCMANRTEFPARGLQGGADGAPREHRINDKTIHPKGHYELAPGDRITLIEAGGGGFGDPAQRAPEAILADIRGRLCERGTRCSGLWMGPRALTGGHR